MTAGLVLLQFIPDININSIPDVDGNGRCARLLMNYVLLTSGYPWVTIRVEARDTYFKTLEEAHLNEDILPFAKFILSFLKK